MDYNISIADLKKSIRLILVENNNLLNQINSNNDRIENIRYSIAAYEGFMKYNLTKNETFFNTQILSITFKYNSKSIIDKLIFNAGHLEINNEKQYINIGELINLVNNLSNKMIVMEAIYEESDKILQRSYRASPEHSFISEFIIFCQELGISGNIYKIVPEE